MGRKSNKKMKISWTSS